MQPCHDTRPTMVARPIPATMEIYGRAASVTTTTSTIPAFRFQAHQSRQNVFPIVMTASETCPALASLRFLAYYSVYGIGVQSMA